MFRVFQEEKLITICMFAFLGGSILLRVFLGLLYRNMIKEADNMASTRNRLLKQCKTKFASCYQLGNGVANIPVFVDKFLNRMALGRLSFETIYHLSGQMMLLSVVFSGIGVCKSIMGGRTVGDVLPFYIVSFFGLYVYFSVSTVVDVRGKKRVLKINLVDYLENHLSPRIEVTRQDMEMLYGEAAYEEKQLPYGRVQGGKKGRGRNRKGVRGVQAKPERRRTVELMPIESRMAAGGEALRGEIPAEQVYPARQQMRADMERQMSQGQEGRQPMGVPQPGGARQMAQAEEGWQPAGALRPDGARQMAQAEDGWQPAGALRPDGARQQPRGQEGQQPAGAPYTDGARQQPWGQEGQQPMGVPQPEGMHLAEQQARPEGMWQAPGSGRAQPDGAQVLEGVRAEEGRQACRMAPGQPLSPGPEAPEDSAAVTEEELEALLKEFLAT